MLEQDLEFFRRLKEEKIKRRKIEDSGDRLKEPNLIAISNTLDEFYFLDKLRLYCAYLSYSKIVNPELVSYSTNDFRLVKEIIEIVNVEVFYNKPIHLYNQIRKLYEAIDFPTNNSNQYKVVLQLINDQSDGLEYEMLEELYSFLANYCIRRLNFGEKEYIEHYFLISIKLLELKYGPKHSQKSVLPGSVFKNIIVSALKLKNSSIFQSIDTTSFDLTNKKKTFTDAFDWIDIFIKGYASRLEKKDHKLYVPYCKSLIEFERKNFTKAYKILQNPSHQRGVFMNMNIKILNLKVLYEINAIKPAILNKDNVRIEKVLEAFRGLLRDERSRKKEISYQLEFYSLFEELFKKLFRLYSNYNGVLYNEKNNQFLKEKKELTGLIQATHYSYKDWFLEKINNIN